MLVECGRLNQPSWLFGVLSYIYIYLLTYLLASTVGLCAYDCKRPLVRPGGLVTSTIFIECSVG